MMSSTVRMTGNIIVRKLNANSKYISERNFRIGTAFTWLINIFNSVDKERIDLVGPDFACAEWLLRNGASVRFKGQNKFITDYNALIAVEESPLAKVLKMQEIYAEEASLTSAGFEHIKNCEHINKITLIKCRTLEDWALSTLRLISGTLQYLEIRSCPRVTDTGVLFLADLKNLNKLVLSNLPSVKNKVNCENVLKKELPKCDIQFHD